ncbi:MAG: hypothetical protein PARBB_01158 [Parabacteroides distasonis]
MRAKNVAIESRVTTTLRVMRTTPPMISPATPKIKAPAQKIAPKRAVSNAVAILRNACPMYRIAFISFCFLIYADLRVEGVEFQSLFRLLLSDIFFMRLLVASVVFVSVTHSWRVAGKQGFLKKYYPTTEVWRFFQKQEA